jgi:drug/metabolite transporter superfamily protein YnfA
VLIDEAMIRRRLNHIEFALRLSVLLLPLAAFGIAAYVRFGMGFFPVIGEGVDYPAYFGLLLLTTLAWTIVVEHYDLSRVDYLVPSRTATWRALVASTATYLVATGTTFFYRTVSFSRLFVVLSGVVVEARTAPASWL